MRDRAENIGAQLSEQVLAEVGERRIIAAGGDTSVFRFGTVIPAGHGCFSP